jgi:hypothetical protein
VTRFSASISVFLCQYHSTIPPSRFSHTHCSYPKDRWANPANLPKKQRYRKRAFTFSLMGSAQAYIRVMRHYTPTGHHKGTQSWNTRFSVLSFQHVRIRCSDLRTSGSSSHCSISLDLDILIHVSDIHNKVAPDFIIIGVTWFRVPIRLMTLPTAVRFIHETQRISATVSARGTQLASDTRWRSWLRHCATRSRVRFPMVSLDFFISWG